MAVAVRRSSRGSRRRLRGNASADARSDKLRRIADIVIAAILLVMVTPVLLVAMAAVRCTGRPVFFAHKRLGQRGVLFRLWKLRTMQPNAERRLETEPRLRASYRRNGFKIPLNEDPRITRVGRWLRQSYIDEIPQLINVLRGEMTLVGPRPVIPVELRNYGRNAHALLRVKPGLIGAWTSLGRRRPAYPERARLELEYIENRSVRRDFSILLRSIPALIAGQNY